MGIKEQLSEGIISYNKGMKEAEKIRIKTARKYGLDPGGLKCEAFSLFDQGYSTQEVRYLRHQHKDPEYPYTLGNTIRRYRILWTHAQQPPVKKSRHKIALILNMLKLAE